MGKLIIDNRTNIKMEDILPYIKAVLAKGRISNNGKQYCYGISFNNGVNIYSDLNKKSDRLIVIRR